MRPFAIELYDHFRAGETPQQLSAALEIPLARIEQRLRAAAKHMLNHWKTPDWDWVPQPPPRTSVALKTILIVDREPDVRRTVQDLLARSNCQVLEVQDAREALAAADVRSTDNRPTVLYISGHHKQNE